MSGLIYWEMQDSDMMCAVHALNSLVQYPYWDPISLAQIARDIDHLEGQLLASTGPSLNVSEDGYFSIQAISKALEAFGLKIDYFSKTKDPCNETGFICNYHHHWISIRNISGIWFNLNSLAEGPEIISDFKLSAWMAELSAKGFSIFQVTGDFPLFNEYPELSPVQMRVPVESIRSSITKAFYNEQEELRKALEMSRKANGGVDDEDLMRAIEMSNMDEELKKAIELSMQPGRAENEEMSEEEMLKLAIEMSKHV